jgi:hypothetical protein
MHELKPPPFTGEVCNRHLKALQPVRSPWPARFKFLHIDAFARQFLPRLAMTALAVIVFVTAHLVFVGLAQPAETQTGQIKTIFDFKAELKLTDNKKRRSGRLSRS